MVRFTRTLTGALCTTLLLTGCIFGPGAIKRSRAQYNQAIQRTQDEQLLLNLVRLRYRDTPLFLEVTSVSTQYTFDGGASTSGTAVEGGPDSVGFGLSAGYSEKPTVTLSPLQGKDFVERVLTPVSIETVLTLTRAGWSVERVLRLCANHLNGLDNASNTTGPTPTDAPRHAQFAEAANLLRTLQLAGALEVGQVGGRATLSEPLAAERVSAADLIAAAEKGYRFEAANGSGLLKLTGDAPRLVMEFHPAPAQEEATARLRELLNLDASESHVGVSVGATGPRSSEPGDQLIVGTRSLMGTLYFLSNAVEVPDDHGERGLVTTTLDEAGQPFDWTRVTGDLLRVHSQTWPPVGAAVAVQHRGHWFYIDDTDLNSKSTFALLSQLFALQAGGAESTTPVLTLPIGG
jgi:hypothetical protein